MARLWLQSNKSQPEAVLFFLRTKASCGHFFVYRGEEGGLSEGLVQDLDNVKGWFQSRTSKTNRSMDATSAAAGLSKALVCAFRFQQYTESFRYARTMACGLEHGTKKEDFLEGSFKNFVKGWFMSRGH